MYNLWLVSPDPLSNFVEPNLAVALFTISKTDTALHNIPLVILKYVYT